MLRFSTKIAVFLGNGTK